MYHASLTCQAAKEDILVPMFDNRVGRVDYGSVHIKKDSREIVDLWRACEGWGFL